MADSFVLPLALHLSLDGGAWLREVGDTFPAEVTEGRYPSYQEARAALTAVPGWQVEGSEQADGSSWVLVVRRADGISTHLRADARYRYSQPGALRFHFEGGWPCLVVQVLECLARVCDPFAVCSPDAVAVVLPGTEPEGGVGRSLRPRRAAAVDKAG
jgi:hypothetical protein